MGFYKEGKNWKVQVYYKDWQGNQKRKQKRGFRTKGEAREWERDFLQQQSQGVDIEFGNFLEIYYKDMDVRLRENTMYTKRYIIDLKIKPYEYSCAMKSHFRKFGNQMSGSGNHLCNYASLLA